MQSRVLAHICAIFLLGTIAAVAAVPAASQTQFAFGSSAEADASAGNGAGDISVADHVSKPARVLSQEEIGDINLVRKRYQAAIQEYSKVENRSASLWNKLGIAYQMMFDLKDATHCYKESLKIDPKNFKALNNLATLQDASKDFAAAERTYRKSLELEPNSAITLLNLGTNLIMQHQHEKAAELYKQALAINPRIFEEHVGPEVSDPAPPRENGTANYYKAKSCARAGLNDCAINFLIQAFNEGAATVKKVSEESDFAPILGTPALKRLLANEQ